MKYIISIIIPVFNEEANLPKLFTNLAKLSFNDNYEIIFIDDGSSDRSSSIIHEFSKLNKHVKYVFQENSGVGAARNKGIIESKGVYVCFLDADDYYHPLFLEKMITKIRRTESDACYCGYYLKTPTKTKKIRTKFKSNDYLLDYILGKIKAHTDSWVIKKDFLVNNYIKFNEAMNWGEDFYFFCQVLKTSNNITSVKENLTFYTHQFTDNRLSKNEIEKLDQDVLLINEVIKILQLNSEEIYYSALIDYRLPTMLLNRLIDLLNNQLTISEMKKMRKYEHLYTRFSFNYGSASIKQIIRFFQFNLKFLVKKEVFR